MIGEDLDKQIWNYIGYLRSTGAVVNTAVVIASAEGILMYKDPGLLLYCEQTINLARARTQYCNRYISRDYQYCTRCMYTV